MFFSCSYICLYFISYLLHCQYPNILCIPYPVVQFYCFSVPGLSHSTLSRTPLPGARDPHMVSASSKLWTPLIPHKQYHKPPGAADIYTKVNTSIRYCQDLGRGSESQVWSVFSVAEEIVLMPFGLSGHCPLAYAAWQRIKLDKSREERRYRTEREDTHVARPKSSLNECPQIYAPSVFLRFWFKSSHHPIFGPVCLYGTSPLWVASADIGRRPRISILIQLLGILKLDMVLTTCKWGRTHFIHLSSVTPAYFPNVP